jgi:hypothetical protein
MHHTTTPNDISFCEAMTQLTILCHDEPNSASHYIIKDIMREDEIEQLPHRLNLLTILQKMKRMFQHDPIRDKKLNFNQYHITRNKSKKHLFF